MPTGSGKIRTITSFFKMYLGTNERVLFLHSFKELVEQSKSLLSVNLLDEQYTVETLNNLANSNINGYDYLVLELEDFRNKQSLLEKLYQEFNGIIIGLYGVSTDLSP